MAGAPYRIASDDGHPWAASFDRCPIIPMPSPAAIPLLVSPVAAEVAECRRRAAAARFRGDERYAQQWEAMAEQTIRIARVQEDIEHVLALARRRGPVLLQREA